MRVLVCTATTLVSALMAGGCASSSHSAPKAGTNDAAQSSAPVESSCIATVSGATLSTWRTIVADKFTFCVPPDWHGRGHNWRATAATMEWGTGKARGKPIKVAEARVVSRSERAAGVRPTSDAPPGADIQRFTDQIDGHSVTLWRNKINGKFYVGGQWDMPQVWMLGEADDSRSADVQMMIVRTVRFVPK